jgi:hypothetical protein
MAAVLLGQLTLLALATFGTSQAPLRGAHPLRLRWPKVPELTPLLAFFGLYWAVIVVHVIGVQVDPAITAWTGADYARALYDIEGDAVSWFQTLRHPALEAVFLAAYIFGYPFMIYFAPLFYLAHRDGRALKLAALSFAVLYALTLPFYLFAPISNPWAVSGEPWYQGQAVTFHLGELWPDITQSYWQFTTPNNELPSLHAAISAMTALVAWRAGYRRFAMFAGVFAALIPVASFAMGVHWILDAIVGEAFAVIAVLAGSRLATRWKTGSVQQVITVPSPETPLPAGEAIAPALEARDA